MSQECSRRFFYVCLGLLVGVCPGAGRGAVADAAGGDPSAEMAAKMIARQRRQLSVAVTQKAFHDFSFADRTAESGITFHSHAVDDVGRYNIPIHYDHGCGIAVADVD